MANNLSPIPSPGLTLYPGFTATKPETFAMKERSILSTKKSFLVSFATSEGSPVTPFLEICEVSPKNLSFKTMNGEEVMRIVKEKHSWSGRAPEYYGMRGDGNQVWHLKLHQGLGGLGATEYSLTVLPGLSSPEVPQKFLIQNKVLGQEKGILLNGNPVATMSRQGQWSGVHRQDVIHVAAGMDILLALGVSWVRVDKQAADDKIILKALT